MSSLNDRNVLMSVFKRIAKPLVALFVILAVYTGYAVYSYTSYGRLPWYKKDIALRDYIVADFPEGYDVDVVPADLVGFGDKFYVAYGNCKFITNGYFIAENTIEEFQKNKGKINYPLIRVYHVRDIDILSSFSSVFSFFGTLSGFVELQLEESLSLSLIPVSSEDVVEGAVKEYEDKYGFPHSFSISDVVIDDVDGDDKDEVIVTYLDYGGGSGGIKYSAIIEIVDGELKISSGYPDFFNIEFSRVLRALERYSGLNDEKYADYQTLRTILGESDTIRAFKEGLEEGHLSPEVVHDQIVHLQEMIQTYPDTLYDISNKKHYSLYRRYTDDYAAFHKIGDIRVFAEAFYIVDDEAHWAPHLWRLMGFRYNDGRWISDRNINGNTFNGVWLDEDQKFTLNEVFGTRPEQGHMGLAFSFLNPKWTASSRKGVSDVFGGEMRVISPVDKKLRKIYSYCD